MNTSIVYCFSRCIGLSLTLYPHYSCLFRVCQQKQTRKFVLYISNKHNRSCLYSLPGVYPKRTKTAGVSDPVLFLGEEGVPVGRDHDWDHVGDHVAPGAAAGDPGPVSFPDPIPPGEIGGGSWRRGKCSSRENFQKGTIANKQNC